ncbi:putative tyrosinase [Nemania sp. FL0031]|nr:putative tyrosinase [Nemania sp. FL0031]
MGGSVLYLLSLQPQLRDPHTPKICAKVQRLYDSGENRSILENLVRAWRGIKALPPYHPNSFFCIAGFHGEPFRGPGVTDSKFWGGYCNHGNVLFPTWHRAYLLRLENALRSIPGCENVTLPFWDELLDVEHPVPTILTSPTFDLDGDRINPLYSYTLQESLIENVDNSNSRYTKKAGYETVRYPLAGLVGTEEDEANSEAHNEAYPDAETNIKILNQNVAAWLTENVHIPLDDGVPPTDIPDISSVSARYRRCLEAPNYTVFSNTTSQAKWNEQHHEDSQVVSLESPHNAIHLAVGGFYQKGILNANPIIDANGDMGDNETASFDPIFYFHHCFIDYAFWKWQEYHKKTTPGSLEIMEGYDGTSIGEGEGMPYLPPGTQLDMKTSLYPFRKENQTYYCSDDLVDIRSQLGYQYAHGSLDLVLSAPGRQRDGINLGISKRKRVTNVNRAHYPGSFVIRLFAKNYKGEEFEIDREAILSRRNIAGCANCQNHLEVNPVFPIPASLEAALRGPQRDRPIKYSIKIHTHNSFNDNPVGSPRASPALEDLQIPSSDS